MGEGAGTGDAGFAAEDDDLRADFHSGHPGANRDHAADTVAAEDVGEFGAGGVHPFGEIAIGGVEGGVVELDNGFAGIWGGIGEVGELHRFDSCLGFEQPGFHEVSGVNTAETAVAHNKKAG